MIIDCGSCAVAGPACDDCVVSVLLGPAPEIGQTAEIAQITEDASVVRLPVASVDDEHAAALAVLAEAGLVPPLRLVRRSEAS